MLLLQATDPYVSGGNGSLQTSVRSHVGGGALCCFSILLCRKPTPPPSPPPNPGLTWVIPGQEQLEGESCWWTGEDVKIVIHFTPVIFRNF